MDDACTALSPAGPDHQPVAGSETSRLDLVRPFYQPQLDPLGELPDPVQHVFRNTWIILPNLGGPATQVCGNCAWFGWGMARVSPE